MVAIIADCEARNHQKRRCPRSAQTRAGALGLLPILEKPFAGLELDGLDAALERLDDGGILLEAGAGLGLFAEEP
jgi:hypothetical protein